MRSLLAVFLLVGFSCSSAHAELPDVDITVFDDGFHSYIEKDAKFEMLAEDLGWAEGPVWADSLNALLFSDVAKDIIYRWDEFSGLSVYLTPSGHTADLPASAWRGSNGLAIDGDGNLFLAQQSNRQLAKMKALIDAPEPSYETLADRYQGKSVNSPNDLIVHESGDVYFTDPPYGLSGFENSPARELDFFGVFRLSPDGQLSVVDKTLEKPNGLAFSPDRSLLYVSNSEEGKEKILAISLDKSGQPTGSEVFFDAACLSANGPGSTDGMTAHSDGHLFVSLPNGFGILSPRGKLLGYVGLGQVTNLALNSAESYLYVTRPNQLLRVRLNWLKPDCRR